MTRKILIAFFCLWITIVIVLFGCSDNESIPDGNDDFIIAIVQPSSGDTVVGTLFIRAECQPTPDYVEFLFDTFHTEIDSISPYYAQFDILSYSSGEESVKAIAHWDDMFSADEISFYIEYCECDSTAAVVLDNHTIPEYRIQRDSMGCVIGLNLSSLDISDPDCLYGIEQYPLLEILSLDWNNLTELDLCPLTHCQNLRLLSLYENRLVAIDLTPLEYCINVQMLDIGHNELTTINLSPLSNCINLQFIYFDWNKLTSVELLSNPNVEYIHLDNNLLTDVDLSPLSLCTNLKWLHLENNRLTSIELSPIWELDSLFRLYLSNNSFHSVSCAQICDFIDEHPNCQVRTDCDCAQNSHIIIQGE
ncbi:hypothetical protein DRQ33_04725 [bacterium]|nr:MAG: hypothetical protein DRQ33_04725 [bacterium]